MQKTQKSCKAGIRKSRKGFGTTQKSPLSHFSLIIKDSALPGRLLECNPLPWITFTVSLKISHHVNASCVALGADCSHIGHPSCATKRLLPAATERKGKGGYPAVQTDDATSSTAHPHSHRTPVLPVGHERPLLQRYPERRH